MERLQDFTQFLFILSLKISGVLPKNIIGEILEPVFKNLFLLGTGFFVFFFLSLKHLYPGCQG